jgi:nucleoside-diphosphate-sugar epimerase
MTTAGKAALRVAVTGGSGKIGREAVKALKAAGHRPVNFDIRPSPDGVRTTIVDFTDFGQTIGALSGVDAVGGVPDAVVHLAGIPAPGLAADHHIFQTNTQSTYNVFSACKRLGITRIVWASSETVLGLPFDTPPAFAPLDETHPNRPEWSYSLSKHLGEAMADQFARWTPEASIASLRFSNAFTAGDYATLGRAQARPELRRMNVWGYVDARDCGEACRLAVENAPAGHEAMIIAAADTAMDIPTAELLRRFFPEVPVRGPMDAYQSLLSSEKAARLIGYRPGYSWRDPQLG